MVRWLTAVACLFLLAAACRGQEERNADDDRCARNLGNIIKCCHLFSDAAQNEGKFPAKLEDLVGRYLRDPNLLLCPRAGKHTPGKGPVAVCDYIYLPGSTPVDAMNIVAFCPKHNHGGKYIFTIGAGSVETTDEAEFRKKLKETVAELKLNLELPKAPAGAVSNAEEQSKLAEQLKGLASENFATREASGKALSAAGEAARPVLEEGAKSADPEVATRCQQLLADLQRGRLDADRVLLLREILGMDAPGATPPSKPPTKE